MVMSSMVSARDKQKGKWFVIDIIHGIIHEGKNLNKQSKRRMISAAEQLLIQLLPILRHDQHLSELRFWESVGWDWFSSVGDPIPVSTNGSPHGQSFHDGNGIFFGRHLDATPLCSLHHLKKRNCLAIKSTRNSNLCRGSAYLRKEMGDHLQFSQFTTSLGK